MTHDAPVYLDHNATTPLLPECLDAMLPYLREHFGNPSSGHVYGTRARAAVAHAREQVAAFLGCEADEVLFTSGGTEANNLAIRGVAEAAGARRQLVTTVIEHPATARPCGWLEEHGWRVTRLGVDTEGRARLDEARDVVNADTALVTVMHSNNETGVYQPVAELARFAHAAGAVIHTDAAQSLGKTPVDVRDLGVDLLSVAGHKLYAPKGVGALYVRRGTSLVPFTLGASHERGLRPGTENVASIVGLGVACEVAGRELESVALRMRARRDLLWERLASAIPGMALNGHRDLCLPNTLSVRFPDVSGDAVLAGAPDVAASTGSACHEGHESASAVILAMGIKLDAALGTVRLCVGRGTTVEDIERATVALVRSWTRLTGP
ncbi:cysteine desulfurase [Corallococcus sp. CA047B]|uniref:cysteine desulfurase family protein n=1 Tax=Corallococcus sp. CA047B TaxID=2316729 RepID=UPI000EA22C67|nr:cysteine desulfurase family protein [Corallococcus sp. CA047B]RKH18015.1 cysteine desulfurase [Corallococcus sp. CA047B]